MINRILKLSNLLYPRGRAFKMPLAGVLEQLHTGLSVKEKQAFLDGLSTLDSAIPDNANFTAQDASDWEVRYGLITNTSVALADRKAAIIRKINFPGEQSARQHYLFVQSQLQLAGFNVYVYENRFSDGMGGLKTKTPLEVISSTMAGPQLGSGQLGDNQLGPIYPPNLFTYIGNQLGDTQLGDTELGSYYAFTNKVANHISEAEDLNFNIGSNYKSTFYIGGTPIGTFANIPLPRKNEFRQLILKLKPAQTVALLLTNYI